MHACSAYDRRRRLSDDLVLPIKQKSPLQSRTDEAKKRHHAQCHVASQLNSQVKRTSHCIKGLKVALPIHAADIFDHCADVNSRTRRASSVADTCKRQRHEYSSVTIRKLSSSHHAVLWDAASEPTNRLKWQLTKAQRSMQTQRTNPAFPSHLLLAAKNRWQALLKKQSAL